MPGLAESGDESVAAAECGGGAGEEGEGEQLREVKFQRAIDMDTPSVRSFAPYKYKPIWIFGLGLIFFFLVLPRLR
jgi:hypothetical protein